MSDWNAYIKKSAALPRGQSDQQSVFDGFQDSLLNAFSKLHKTDKRFVDIKERTVKLEHDVVQLEKLISRAVRKQGDLAIDYVELSDSIEKLAELEPESSESITAFQGALIATSEQFGMLKESIDSGYITSLQDLAAYAVSLRSLLKLRDQRQLDAEALTDYLEKTTSERDSVSSPHHSTGYINRKVEDLRGVDHEQARKDRLKRLQIKSDDLTREVERANFESDAFDDAVIRESVEFERIKSLEQKVTLGKLADANIAFFEQVIYYYYYYCCCCYYYYYQQYYIIDSLIY